MFAVAVLRPIPGRGASAELRCRSLWRGHPDEKATASPPIGHVFQGPQFLFLENGITNRHLGGHLAQPTPQSPRLLRGTVQVHPRRTTSVPSCLSPIPCHVDTVLRSSLLCNVQLRQPARELASALASPSRQRLICYSISGLSRMVLESLRLVAEGSCLCTVHFAFRSFPELHGLASLSRILTVSPPHISSTVTFCGAFYIPSVSTS